MKAIGSEAPSHCDRMPAFGHDAADRLLISRWPQAPTTAASVSCARVAVLEDGSEAVINLSDIRRFAEATPAILMYRRRAGRLDRWQETRLFRTSSPECAAIPACRP